MTDELQPEIAASTGAMVALFPPAELAQRLAVEGGLPAEELHVTLAFLGEAAALDVDKLRTVVAGWAATVPVLRASMAGVGFFASSHTDEPVTWAAVDIPALPRARQRLVEMLAEAGLPVRLERGYIPHLTLIYADRRETRVEQMDLVFDQVYVVTGEDRVAYDLRPERVQVLEAARAGEPAVFSTLTWPTTTVLTTGTQTFVVTPATVHRERAAANKHLLWIEGAYVGSEVPNRNNAMWTTKDLEFGAPSVQHGPLNWLHEGRHVIGTIADAELVYPVESAEEGRDHPYIRTSAAIWTWLHPDEAEVVAQAAEWGRLFQSMECYSETATCVGENGCGQTFSYSQLVRNKACEHLRERSSVRRMNNPTFLGGAVIVPPARPGWAHANTGLRQRAAALAEETFDDASGLSAAEWEQQMLAVLSVSR